jgi:WD40 repeat protein
MAVSYEEFYRQVLARITEFPDIIYYLELLVYGSDFTKLKRTFLKGHDEGVYDVCFDAAGDILASASRDKTVRFWRKQDAFKFEPVEQLLEFTSYVWTVRFSKYGIVTGDAEGIIKFWDLDSILRGSRSPLIKELPIGSPNNPVLRVSFSPNDQYIAAANLDNDVKLWSIKLKPQVGKIVQEEIDTGGNPVHFPHGATVYDVCFSPDSKGIASAGLGGSVKYWKIEDGSEQTPKIFTPESDLRTKAEAEVSEGKDPKLVTKDFTMYQVSFSHKDGSGTLENQMIASANGDGTISIWHLSTGKLLNTLEHSSNKKSVFGVCFSPDGQKIASCGDDRTIKIWLASNGDWSAVDGKKPHHTYWHGDAVNRVSFSHDGTILTSGIADGNVGIYQTSAIGEADHKDEIDQLLEDAYTALIQFIQLLGGFDNLVDTISKIFTPGR